MYITYKYTRIGVHGQKSLTGRGAQPKELRGHWFILLGIYRLGPPPFGGPLADTA